MIYKRIFISLVFGVSISSYSMMRDELTSTIVHTIASEGLPESPALSRKQLNNWLATHTINEPINSNGDRLLHVAARFGSPESARILLAIENREIDIPNQDGNTPLKLAAVHKHPELVELLLQHGANPYLLNTPNKTFNILEVGGRPDEYDKMREIQALLTKATLLPLSEAHPAAARSDTNLRDITLEDIKNLVTQGTLKKEQLIAWINQGNSIDTLVNEKKDTLLHLAVEYAGPSSPVVEILLQQQADPTIKNADGNSPFHVALWRYSYNLNHLEQLLNHHADINASDQQGRTPLRIAMERDNIPLINFLLAKNAIITIKDLDFARTSRDYPLYLLTYQLVVNALASGNVDQQDPTTGETPLHYIVDLSDVEMAKSLLKQGAKLSIKNNRGNSPLHDAIRFGKTKLVELFLDYNADINDPDEQGDTPLFLAIEFHHAPIVKLLVEKGAVATPKELTLLNKIVDSDQRTLIINALASRSPNPSYKPAASPSAQQPAGGPAGPGIPIVQPVIGAQAPNLLQRQKLIRFAIASAITAVGYGAYYLASAVPTDLDCEQLQDKLVTALTNRDYYYAYQFAQKNLRALQKLDPAAHQNIKALIEQAELDLIEEITPKSLNPFQPSVSTQLSYLADLSRLIEQSTKDRP